LYSKQIKLIGSVVERTWDIINVSKELKVRIWKRFKLKDAKEILQALFAKDEEMRHVEHVLLYPMRRVKA
jgi:hypothetical protein